MCVGLKAIQELAVSLVCLVHRARLLALHANQRIDSQIQVLSLCEMDLQRRRDPTQICEFG